MVSLTLTIILFPVAGLPTASSSRDMVRSLLPLSLLLLLQTNQPVLLGLYSSVLGGSHPLHLCPSVPPDLEQQREHWEQQQQKRRQQRSVSKEKWVETLVVADSKMVEFHGQPQVESYVLTIMNMVRLLQFLQGWSWWQRRGHCNGTKRVIWIGILTDWLPDGEPSSKDEGGLQALSVERSRALAGSLEG